MWAGMIAFWGLLVWAAYALITGLARKPPDTRHGSDDARAILDQRLARGEMSPEEYQRHRDLLGLGDHQVPASSGSAR